MDASNLAFFKSGIGFMSTFWANGKSSLATNPKRFALSRI